MAAWLYIISINSEWTEFKQRNMYVRTGTGMDGTNVTGETFIVIEIDPAHSSVMNRDITTIFISLDLIENQGNSYNT